MLLRKRNFYETFLGLLIKSGQKVQAKNILDTAFSLVSKQTKLSTNSILLKIVLNLNSFVEIKKIKSKRSTHFVPFPLSTKRKFYLIARWVVDSVGEDSRKINFAIKLSEEILMIVLKKPCKSVLKKNLNFKQSVQNKSNIHYRW
jgi:ribosomal protein S7